MIWLSVIFKPPAPTVTRLSELAVVLPPSSFTRALDSRIRALVVKPPPRWASSKESCPVTVVVPETVKGRSPTISAGAKGAAILDDQGCDDVGVARIQGSGICRVAKDAAIDSDGGGVGDLIGGVVAEVAESGSRKDFQITTDRVDADGFARKEGASRDRGEAGVGIGGGPTEGGSPKFSSAIGPGPLIVLRMVMGLEGLSKTGSPLLIEGPAPGTAAPSPMIRFPGHSSTHRACFLRR